MLHALLSRTSVLTTIRDVTINKFHKKIQSLYCDDIYQHFKFKFKFLDWTSHFFVGVLCFLRYNLFSLWVQRRFDLIHSINTVHMLVSCLFLCYFLIYLQILNMLYKLQNTLLSELWKYTIIKSTISLKYLSDSCRSASLLSCFHHILQLASRSISTPLRTTSCPCCKEKQMLLIFYFRFIVRWTLTGAPIKKG